MGHKTRSGSPPRWLAALGSPSGWVVLGLWLCLAAGTLPAGLAAAQEKRLVDLATEALEEGRFADAALFMERAYAEDPDPLYLYNAGFAYSQAGELEKSKEQLERYLATGPAEVERRVAEGELAKVRAALASRVSPIPDGSGVEEEPFDWAPWAAVSGGALVMGGAAVLYVLAEGKRGDLSRAETDEAGLVTEFSQAEAYDMETQADAMAWSSLGLGVAGGALAAWGIWMALGLNSPESQDSLPGGAVVPGGGGGALLLWAPW